MIALCIVVFQAGKLTGAGTEEPGSTGDPLITKSYLEQRLAGLSTDSDSSVSQPAISSFTYLSLKDGQILTASQGTSLLFYSGNAIVTGNAGLINLSNGELSEKGTSTALYQLFFSPSNECSIQAIGSATLFVQGGYTIQ